MTVGFLEHNVPLMTNQNDTTRHVASPQSVCHRTHETAIEKFFARTNRIRGFGRYLPGQCHRIRGAFCPDEFPFRPLPHEPGGPLVIGRISQAAPDKFSADTWAVYRRIPHPIRARVMAWANPVQKKLGLPPDWAECLAARAESPQQFFATLHVMLPINGGAGENWPRAGLEAMAAGVPVVAENRWGWREMIRHGRTGYLAGSDDELAFYAARLAYDEPHRLEIVHHARKVLEEELADPETIWTGWRTLLEGLAE